MGGRVIKIIEVIVFCCVIPEVDIGDVETKEIDVESVAMRIDVVSGWVDVLAFEGSSYRDISFTGLRKARCRHEECLHCQDEK